VHRGALIARRRLEEAAASLGSVSSKIQEESEGNRRALERFYTGLALYSGGTVALSVTFLGYLKSLPRAVAYPHWLIASWICLIIAAACSLFFVLFNTNYVHYGRSREYTQKLIVKLEAYQEVAPFQTFESEGDLEEYKSKIQEAIKQSNDDKIEYERNEKLYAWLYKWCGRVAQMGFLVGLIILLCFAVANI